MSRALAHRSLLEPEVRLAQAISEFLATLSQSQKAEVHSHERMFDVNDIMRLTAEIDRESTAKANERIRCYGPRVTSFLEGLHQFAGTVDVAIGGTGSPIASGVWAVVRFSLLALTKYSPYIEKLSKVLMETSKSMPRVNELHKLFPRSRLLQEKFYEYYTVIVQLCQELLKISQRSAVAQLWTAFAEERYTDQLRKLSNAINTEVYLETTKLVKSESKRQTSFRLASKEHMNLQRRQYRQDRKQQILDACSQFNYRTIWKQVKGIGTTMLFAEVETYHEWFSTPTSCTLVYSGPLGSGKSVLLANIVSDLYLRQKTCNSIIAHFFCRHDVDDSLKPAVVIGCLARQILEHSSGIEALDAAITLNTTFDMDEALELIKTAASKPVYFVLDGIDDLKPTARQELLKVILKLQDSISLRLCLATRSPNDVFHGVPHSKIALYATIPLINPEIEAYIQTEVDNRLTTGTLIISNDDLVREVKERLAKESQGMFLWVYLQLVSLSSMLSDKQIREAIEDLPKGLAETYSRLLQSQGYSESQYCRCLFQLVLAARRPLTYEEMREALSVEPGNLEYHPETLLNSLHGILRSCSGLVLLDEEEETLRLVHSSARQFLITSTYVGIQASDCEHKITETIFTYMNYSLFENRITLHGNRALSSAELPAAILIKNIPIASKFIRIKQNKDLDKVLYNAGIRQKQFRFKSYATAYWDQHLIATDTDAAIMDLAKIALEARRLDINVRHTGLTPLLRAVEASSSGLVGLFLRYNPSISDKTDATIRALSMRNPNVAKILIQQRDIVAIMQTNNLVWRSFFNMALRNHNDDIVDILENLVKLAYVKDTFYVYLLENDVKTMALFLSKTSKTPRTAWFNEVHPTLNNKTPWMFTTINKEYVMLQLFSTNYNFKYMMFEGDHPWYPLQHAIKNVDLKAVDILTSQLPSGLERFQRELWEFIFEDLHRSTFSGGASFEVKTKRAKITALMLKRGALLVRVSELYNPFFKAVFFAQLDIVEVILKYDPSVVNELYEIPEHEALGTSNIQGLHTAWDLCEHRLRKDHSDKSALRTIQTKIESYGGIPYEYPSLNSLRNYGNPSYLGY